MSNRLTISTASLLLAAAGFATTASAQVAVRVHKVIAVGDVLPGTEGLTCSSLNDPFTNGSGRIGFTGGSSGGNFVWFDAGVTWLNSSSASPVLTGAETTMGISNTGGFIYSPAADGGDAVWTQAGRLLVAGDSIPSLGLFSSFNSRPRMTPSGAAFWMGGLTATSGGSTSNRALLYAADPANPDIQALIIGGGTYGGLEITTGASNFAYDISDNGLHRMHVLTATGPAATDQIVHHSSSDTVVAREGFAVPGFPAENFSAFRIPAVNNSGSWALAADTTAAAAADEVVLYNGVVVLREGQTVSGVTLSGAVNAISLNNRGRIALIFNGSPESLLAGPGANFASGARVLLKVGDSLDVDGDGICDFALADFNASNAIGPGLDIADDGMVWVNVDLTPCGGGAMVEAIIGVRDICPGDFNGSGDVTVQDIYDFLSDWNSQIAGGPVLLNSADFNGSGDVTVQDIYDFLAAWSAPCI